VANLHPYRRNGSAPADDVLNQFRYVLIIGRLAQDGGHGADAFLPSAAFWLPSGTNAVALEPTKLTSGVPLSGQVLEIELNGAWARGLSPLELSSASMKQLFKRLLSTDGGRGQKSKGAFGPDALGRIKRVSQPVDVIAMDT
jgi:hypothetical protein